MRFKNSKQRKAFFAKNYPNKSNEWLGKYLPDSLLMLSESEIQEQMKKRGITKKDLATPHDRKTGNTRLISVNPYTTDLDNIEVKKFGNLKISQIKQ